MSLKDFLDAIQDSKIQKKEAARISQLAGEWERQEVERAIQHAEPKQ